MANDPNFKKYMTSDVREEWARECPNAYMSHSDKCKILCVCKIYLYKINSHDVNFHGVGFIVLPMYK